MEKQTIWLCVDEYLAQNSSYKKQVKSFVIFLKKSKEQRHNDFFQISQYDIEEFISSSKQIKSIETMNSYLEGIKSLDDFIVSRFPMIQYMIPRGDAYSLFKTKLSTKLSLKEKVSREYLEDSDIINILKSIDQYFENTTYEELGKEGKERYIYWLCLRVYIKISLLIPAKKSVLTNMMISDFEDDYRFVTVNKIKIRIPNGLRNDIRQSLLFVECIAKIRPSNTDKLFEYYTTTVKGKAEIIDTTLNAKFCKFLKDHNLLDIPKSKTSFPLEVLSVSTIYQMIKNGTNPFYIAQITGISISQLDSKYYSKIGDITYTISAEKEINNSIACCEYYQYL